MLNLNQYFASGEGLNHAGWCVVEQDEGSGLDPVNLISSVSLEEAKYLLEHFITLTIAKVASYIALSYLLKYVQLQSWSL